MFAIPPLITPGVRDSKKPLGTVFSALENNMQIKRIIYLCLAEKSTFFHQKKEKKVFPFFREPRRNYRPIISKFHLEKFSKNILNLLTFSPTFIRKYKYM